MTFELPREGVERQAEIALSELQSYVGKYHSETGNLDFEVKISNQRLAVDVPGEMLYELHLPNDEARWVFRPTDRVAVSFNKSDDGQVTSMKLYRDGVQRLELLRVEAAEEEALPTLEDILALRRSAGDTEARSFRMTGRVRLVHAGLEGRLTLSSDGGRRYYVDTDFGRFGWSHQAVTEDEAWIDSNISPFRKLEGKYLTQARVAQALLIPADWLQSFDSVTVTGVETPDDRKTYTLRLRLAELPTITASVDAETGDLLRYEMSVLDPSLGIAIPTVTRLEDYRGVEGVRVAFRTVSRNDFTGETVFEVDEFETDVTIDEGLFARPNHD
jgi:hypothetical protein